MMKFDLEGQSSSGRLSKDTVPTGPAHSVYKLVIVGFSKHVA
jgi:hypothetical protein